ncbi:MAG: aldo/keto reductase [Bacteroidetes bacterium]|nr:aldo/keto reductase [Bacteroidota bacterium]MCY4234331.1 aldo/keto reductase [Bacteroidota bacterium]
MNRRDFVQWMMTAGSATFAHLQTSNHLNELPKRSFGRTNESVTMLGLGGWHLGEMNERDAQATVERAIEGGVRFFDSAESYQNGGSERYLGKFLVPKYRDDIYLMSKTTATTAKVAEQHLNQSLKRLKVDQMDLWQMHAITSPRDVDQRLNAGVLDVMEKALAEEKTRHIGFTGHTDPAAHQRLLELTDVFHTVQCPINVADVSYKSFVLNVLPTAVERNMGIIAMKTLANGGFFGGSTHGQHGDKPRVIPNRISIEDAIYFAWSLPISVIVSGTDDIHQLNEKISLAHKFSNLSEEKRIELIERVADMAGRDLEFYKA